MAKKMTILDIIDPKFIDHVSMDMIYEDEEYKTYNKDYTDAIEQLDTKMKIRIDDDTSSMEGIIRDISFREGFNLAVKMLTTAIAG